MDWLLSVAYIRPGWQAVSVDDSGDDDCVDNVHDDDSDDDDDDVVDGTY